MEDWQFLKNGNKRKSNSIQFPLWKRHSLCTKNHLGPCIQILEISDEFHQTLLEAAPQKYMTSLQKVRVFCVVSIGAKTFC